MEVVVVLKAQHMKCKRSHSPSLGNYPTADKKTTKKNQTLKKLVLAAASTTDLPCPPIDTLLEDVPLV